MLHGDRRLLRQAVYPFAPLRAVVLPGYVEPVALVVVLDSEVNVRVSLEAVVAHPEHVVLPVPLEVCGEEGRQVCGQLRRVVLAEHEEGPAVDARGRDVVRVGVREWRLRGRGRGLRDGLRLCGDACLLPAPARVKPGGGAGEQEDEGRVELQALGCDGGLTLRHTFLLLMRWENSADDPGRAAVRGANGTATASGW